jgi:hypothetical protein
MASTKSRAITPRFARGVLQDIPFYGLFGTETRISLALACPRINQRMPPRGIGVGDLAWATLPCPHAAAAHADLQPVRDLSEAITGLVAQIVAAARPPDS